MRPLQRLRQVVWLVAAALGWISGVWITVLPLEAQPARTTMTYENEKYGFSLNIPADVFVPTLTREQMEGALWESLDGQVRLLAVAGPNGTGESLSSYRAFVMRESYPGAVFDYTPVRDKWFVVSGRQGDRMFYERITFACDGRYIYGWQMNYPVAERRRWDRAVEEIHRSYRVGRGEDGRCGQAERDPSL